ncbi:MAG: hypothetical protein U0704_14245 [Candidatus Eisenbacteria bacterium]
MNALRRLLPLLCLAGLVLLAGCGKNLPTSSIVPTGYRPGTPPGAIAGSILYDTTTYDMPGAPYPPVRIELHTFHHDTLGPLVASSSSGGANRGFAFTGLMPDSYMVQLKAHGFAARDFGPFRVELDPIAAGAVFLPAQSESLPAITFVIGTMPGFSVDDAFGTFATSMYQDPLGLWKYPDFLFGYTSIAAGTYRFKFVTDFSSTPTHLIGWGGDSTITYVAPVTNQPVRFASGPAEDIKVTFPSSGNWDFQFDERRLTFSITPAPPVPALAARTARAVRTRIVR